MSSLLRNPEGKRQLHKWRGLSLTAQPVLEIGGEWRITHGFQPWQGMPLWNLFTFVGWSISISQRCLWWPIWEEDRYLLWLMCLDFGKNIKQSFMETYYSFSIQTSWPPRFELAFSASWIENPPGEGGRRKSNRTKAWWVFWGIYSNLNHTEHFLFLYCGSTHGCVECRISEEPRVWFNALLSPSWNS